MVLGRCVTLASSTASSIATFCTRRTARTHEAHARSAAIDEAAKDADVKNEEQQIGAKKAAAEADVAALEQLLNQAMNSEHECTMEVVVTHFLCAARVVR